MIKATPRTLSNRRIVSAKRIDRKLEFYKNIYALNVAFRDWFREKYQENKEGIFVDAAQDYLDYVSQLEDRYLRAYGEVLTFGSGDCGQLAHGVDNDDDLMVKYPRVVYSLR